MEDKEKAEESRSGEDEKRGGGRSEEEEGMRKERTAER